MTRRDYQDGYKIGFEVGAEQTRKGLMAYFNNLLKTEIMRILNQFPIIKIGCIPKGGGRKLSNMISCKDCKIEEQRKKGIVSGKVCLISADIFAIINKYKDNSKTDMVEQIINPRKIDKEIEEGLS